MDGRIDPNGEPTARLWFRVSDPVELNAAVQGFGETVLLRTQGRTAAQREDWCMRRLMLAMAGHGDLAFPLELRAPAHTGRVGWPDFVLFQGIERHPLGVEVTECTTREISEVAELSEASDELDEWEAYGDSVERELAPIFRNSIEKKVNKARSGSYRNTPVVDLLIYENSFLCRTREYGDLRRFIQDYVRLSDHDRIRWRSAFARVHVIDGNHVYLDILGAAPNPIDWSTLYGADFVGWTRVQAERLRKGLLNAIDTQLLAEEIESLGKSEQRGVVRHLENLYAHWLKWTHQPDLQSRSWSVTIRNSRRDAIELIADSPSLDPRNPTVAQRIPGLRLDAVYEAAVLLAMDETGLPRETFPQNPPHDFEWLLETPEPVTPEPAPRRRGRKLG
jgi:hypothetical protein